METTALPAKLRILPGQGLFAALVYVIVLITVTLGVSLQTPWLGLELAPTNDLVVVKNSEGPSSTIPKGAIIEAIASSSQAAWVELNSIDIMEEPDLLPGYPELDQFFQRQNTIAEITEQQTVLIRWKNPETNQVHTETIRPAERPLHALTPLFWFQLLVCSVGCLIGVWVWVLQQRTPGALLLGITGLLFPAFVLPAAIYSGRELALNGDLFYTLSAANHLGSKMFGAAFVGIFMLHPVRIVNTKWLYGLFLLMFAWWVINAGRLTSSMDIGLRAGILFLLGLSFLFGFLQWRKSKGNLIQRASLRWLTLSLLFGASSYIFLFTALAGLGWITAIPQGYAFGLFLLIYIGIALGIGRYRLFDLDVWAYRLLLWIFATLAVVLLDATLIFLLDWSQGLALGVSLWVCGLLYFPLRQWLWEKLVSRQTPELSALLPEIILIAFSGTEYEREAQWRALIKRIYRPLQMQSCKGNQHRAAILDQGIGLLVPACANMESFSLGHKEEGKQLFLSRDVEFVNTLAALMNQAEQARMSKLQGAIEERRRITRDIHDDVGARLLMLIHRSENPAQADLARSAMEDLRSALNNIDGEASPIEHALADWKDETNQRCDAANIGLTWDVLIDDTQRIIKPRQKSLIQRALRECITNAIKHGNPAHISIQINCVGGILKISVSHDGDQSDPTNWTPGIGITGLHERLASCGGMLNAERLSTGNTRVAIEIPFDFRSDNS